MRPADCQRILLTGATGYVGGHLLGRLEALNLPGEMPDPSICMRLPDVSTRTPRS